MDRHMNSLNGRRGSLAVYQPDPRSQMSSPRSMGMMDDMADMRDMSMAIREVGRDAGYGMSPDELDYRANDGRSRQGGRSMRDAMDMRDGGGLEEKIRRINLAVTLANSQILPEALSAEVQPKMTPEGRFPPEFRSGITLNDLRRMDPRSLDIILAAYDLHDTLRSMPIRLDPQHAKLCILLDFLGVTRVASMLRKRAAGPSAMGY